MRSPLLLKLDQRRECFDDNSNTSTTPVQMVNITELLDGSDGSDVAKYLAHAQLAGLDTYQKLATFDLEAYPTRGQLFLALSNLLDVDLHVEQYSCEEIRVVTMCRKDLADLLPATGMKKKRHISENPDDDEEALRQAVRLINNLRDK